MVIENNNTTNKPIFKFVSKKEQNKKKDNGRFANDPGPIDPPEVDNAIGYAFTLGLADTYRGVKQMVGANREEEKAKQKKLNELMRGENGGWVTAAYFGGALLDPAGWLIPFGKARTLYKMGKYGMVSGAIAGATGYVDEDNPYMDSRTKQAAFGAAGGAILSPAIGTLRNIGVKVTGKGEITPLGFKKFNMTESEMMSKGGSKIQIEGASTEGKAIQDIETGIPTPIKTKGKQTLNISANEEIGKEPTSIFEILINRFKKDYKRPPFPFNKKIRDIPNKVSKPPRWFLSRIFNAAQKNYEEKFGKKGMKFISTGEGGTSFAGAVTGFTGDFSDDGQTPALSTRFVQALIGAGAGYGGIKFLKSKTATEKLGLRKETIMGDGVEQESFIESYPELLGRLFIDRVGLPKQYRQLEIMAQGLETSLAGKMIKMAKQAQKLSEEENRLLYNMLEGDEVTNLSGKIITKDSKEIPEAIRNLAIEARANINKMTQYYIDLGLLSKETAIQNQKKYLMRLYKKQKTPTLSDVRGPLNLEYKKIGDELRTRGLVQEYNAQDYLLKLRYEKNIIDDIVDPNHAGWELPSDVKIINGKLYRVKLKAKKMIDAETNEPMFEEIIDESVERKLLKPTDKVELRWQYSKAERQWLGEIDNAAIAMEYTGLVMSRTIGKYQFFSDVARKYSIDPKGRTAKQMAELGKKKNIRYLKIPESKIEGIDTRKYGALAGKYVPENIYKDIVGMKTYQEQSSNILWEGYKNLNRLWKVSKTAWNPTVHVNNVFGNIILSDLADVPIRSLPRAWKALRTNANGVGDDSDIVELAKFHGVLDADFLRQEIKNFKSEKLAGLLTEQSTKNEWTTAVGFAKNVYKAVKNNDITSTLEDWYKIEDHVFRLNAFMHRIELGDSYADAAMFARQKFIDYDIKAPAINALRNSVTPFLSFTYRMVPILAETAIMRPTKYAKYAALGYGLTNLEGLIAGEKGKKERALLNDWEAGNIMDLPFMPKKVIRIPANDKNGRPKFINISRLFPGGDVLSLDGSNAIPFLPEPLQPSFGVAGDFLMSMIGYDIFRGQKDSNRGDGGFVEESMEAFGMFGKKLIPNFPYVPGSYSTTKLDRARAGEKSKYRVPQTEIEALLNAFGVKVSNKSIKTLKASKKIELTNQVRTQKKKINLLKREYRNEKLTKEEYKKKVAKIKTKIKQLQMIYFGRLQGEDPYAFRLFDDLGLFGEDN